MKRVRSLPPTNMNTCALVCMIDIDYELQGDKICHSIPVYQDKAGMLHVNYAPKRNHHVIASGWSLDELENNFVTNLRKGLGAK